MDFAAFLAALKAWATAQLPAIPFAPAITDQKRVFQSTASSRIEIDEPAIIAAVGQDWRTWADSVDGPIPTVHGNRELDVTIRVVARSHTPGNDPWSACNKLRTSLKFPSVLAAFQAAGIAVVSAQNVVKYNAPNDGRIEAIAAFVVRFGTAVAYVDTDTSGQVDYIALSSALSGTDGATLPTPPNLDDSLIGDP